MTTPHPQTPRRSKRLRRILAAAVLLAAAGYPAWRYFSAPSGGQENSGSTFTVMRGPLEITVLEGGSVEARDPGVDPLDYALELGGAQRPLLGAVAHLGDRALELGPEPGVLHAEGRGRDQNAAGEREIGLRPFRCAVRHGHALFEGVEGTRADVAEHDAERGEDERGERAVSMRAAAMGVSSLGCV